VAAKIYLYIKVHTKTGLKYFGKTTNNNPYSYKGSGSYWQKHIKKHGKDNIETLQVWEFDNQSECTDFALHFSEENNIVKSKDWANLREENGKDGVTSGSIAWNKNKNMSKESCKKMSIAKKGCTPWNKGNASSNIFKIKPELKKQHSERMKVWWAQRKASMMLAHGG
jgi:hypothetical protein